MGLLDKVTTTRTAVVLGVVLLFAAALIACGGGLDGPEPNTKVFEGEDGWALAVPNEPAEAGEPPRIWIRGEFEERIPLEIEFVQIDEPAPYFSWGMSAPPGVSGIWGEAPGDPPIKAGEFELVLTSAVEGEVLARGLLTVE